MSLTNKASVNICVLFILFLINLPELDSIFKRTINEQGRGREEITQLYAVASSQSSAVREPFRQHSHWKQKQHQKIFRLSRAPGSAC